MSFVKMSSVLATVALLTLTAHCAPLEDSLIKKEMVILKRWDGPNPNCGMTNYPSVLSSDLKQAAQSFEVQSVPAGDDAENVPLYSDSTGGYLLPVLAHKCLSMACYGSAEIAVCNDNDDEISVSIIDTYNSFASAYRECDHQGGGVKDDQQFLAFQKWEKDDGNKNGTYNIIVNSAGSCSETYFEA